MTSALKILEYPEKSSLFKRNFFFFIWTFLGLREITFSDFLYFTKHFQVPDRRYKYRYYCSYLVEFCILSKTNKNSISNNYSIYNFLNNLWNF